MQDRERKDEKRFGQEVGKEKKKPEQSINSVIQINKKTIDENRKKEDQRVT